MEDAHPSLDITGSNGAELNGKRIALCVTGSVAASRAPDIARGLMRRGAAVFTVMSEAATHLIHPDLMHWATGRPVITRLTGAVEHVALAGNVPGRVDLILVAPATANTIGKIAAGIDDTPVTSTVTSGLGEGIPLLIVPAMHESMYRHPLVRENIAKLEKIGVRFLLPRLEEGKAKLADTEEIVSLAAALVLAQNTGAPGLFAGKRVLVSLGRTVEYLDPVRVITNNSSGKMGAALVRAARALGAAVTTVAGKTSVPLPPADKLITVGTAEEMAQAVQEELTNEKYDYFIAAAAVGDWKPEERAARKIPTRAEKKITVELAPTPKIIDRAKDWSPRTFLVAFRAVHGLTQDALAADGFERLKRARADLIVVNDVGRPGSGFETDTNEVTVVTPENEAVRLPPGSKADLAFTILKIIHEKSSGRA